MEPSNPSINNPLVLYAMDSNGVLHQVAAVNHIHSISEVNGLTSALAATASKVSGATNDDFAAFDSNGNIKDSGKKATDFAAANHGHDVISGGTGQDTGAVQILSNGSIVLMSNNGVGIVIGSKTAELNATTIDNLIRALQTPDSTPTADSDKLVTSGGVAAALADVVDTITNEDGSARVYTGTTEDGGYVEIIFEKNSQEIGADITFENVGNLIRALQNPDSTPTASSDKFVTSGGVKSALVSAVNEVAEAEYFDSGNPIDLDTLFGDTSIIKKKVIGIRNIQLQEVSIQSQLYSEDEIFIEYGNNLGNIPAEGTVIVTVYWINSSYWVTLNGIFE